MKENISSELKLQLHVHLHHLIAYMYTTVTVFCGFALRTKLNSIDVNIAAVSDP